MNKIRGITIDAWFHDELPNTQLQGPSFIITRERRSQTLCGTRQYLCQRGNRKGISAKSVDRLMTTLWKLCNRSIWYSVPMPSGSNMHISFVFLPEPSAEAESHA